MSSLLNEPHSMTYNPWNVDSIHAFYFLNCPECIFSTKDEYCFQDHALQKHPLSFALFGQDKIKNEVLETNLGTVCNWYKSGDKKTVRRESIDTLPIAKILSVKNAGAWISMVSYTKNK
jgi:hypothetical protein